MFTFIKETSKLVQMLFASKPKDFDSLQTMEMKYYPLGKYDYLTWCGKCIIRKGSTEPTEQDINHENIHLTQAKDVGSWIKYYVKYLWSWMKLSPFFGTYGYYLNKFETEAYAKEDDLEYIARRPANNVEKFDQDDKSGIWKTSRESSYFYIKLIKDKFRNV